MISAPPKTDTFILYSMQSVYSVQYAVCRLVYTLYSIHCTVHTTV